MNISIVPCSILMIATSMQIYIDDFQFGNRLVLRLALYDDQLNFIINYYVEIDGDNYVAMISSENSDLYIKKFIENKLGIIITT